MGRLFGTDGIRGVANADLSTELVDRVARAAVHVLAPQRRGRVAIGRDPRISGDLLEAQFAAGLCSAGADAVRLGVLPTPGVALLTRRLNVDAGVVISASHNPVEDNGIKFFAPTGFKLPDAVEDEIERLIETAAGLARPSGAAVGRITDVPDAAEQYLAFLTGLARGRFGGWRIVVDCANGATSAVAPRLWRDLGATVIPIHAEPDGTNINAGCGSTHPEVVADAVVRAGADLGFAHDGDGDRVIAADRRGRVVDGDAIMGIAALHRDAQGTLPHRAIVATVMTNLGLEVVLRRAGIRLDRVRVGDRYVLERMLETGIAVGGEQSGHVIFLDHATTGDGMLTAVQIANVILESGRGLDELASRFHRYPQVLLNVRVPAPDRWVDDPEILAAVAHAEKHLGERGRVLVRASGTEPLVRVMTECEEAGQADSLARELADLVARRLGGTVVTRPKERQGT
ncbi:MAG TPA: phosphoglucosamine mutase [bacterium]|nr:phosphoglucosamine mutase [bacterium]